jgi:cysteine-rich repeat protein
MNLGTTRRQLLDTNYESEASLTLDAKAGAGLKLPGLASVGKLLGVLFDGAEVKLSHVLSRSPTSLEAMADVARFEAGDPVRFVVKLDPANVTFPPLRYNVQGVRIYRLVTVGGVPEPVLVGDVPAGAMGQTDFDLYWVAPDAGTIKTAPSTHHFFAMAVTSWPEFPFEIAPIEPNPFEMTVTFASTIDPGVPEPLVVKVTNDGQPAANVYIELFPSGGTVVPTTGFTNAQGELSVQAELGFNSGGIDVYVEARSAPGGDLLAYDTVEAVSTVPSTRCELFLGVGANASQRALSGMLVDESVDGPVRVGGSVEFGRAHLEAEYDIANQPWTFSGGGEAIWRDIIVIETGNPALNSGTFRHRTRITYASSVDNRTQPSRSQGWVDIDSAGFNPGGTIGFVNRNFGGDVPLTVVEYVYDQPFFGNEAEVRIRTRISTFTGFGGDEIDAAVDGEITVEWLGVTDAFDHQGAPIPFTWHSMCGGVPPPTTSTTTTVVSTTTTTSTTSSTTSTTTSSSTSSTTTTLVGGDPVVPYRLYDATGPDAPLVALTDEFGSETVDLESVVFELPPVAIDGVPPLDPVTHQTCHAHPGGMLDTCIDVQNVFGLAPLRIGAPVGVCVPEVFPAIAVDAFKCYAAEGTSLMQSVGLADEFQSQTVTVGAPELLCTPVEVDGSPLVHPARYLVCYGTEPPGAPGGPIQVENDLHAAPIQVDVGNATGLCVPAVRQLVATCQLCGDGTTDGSEECDDANTTSGDGCSSVCRLEP